MALDAVHVLGNHDRYLLDRPPEKMGSWDRPAYAQLNAAHLDWLRAHADDARVSRAGFPLSRDARYDEVYWLDTVHARRHGGDLAARPIEQFAQGITQSLILCAHTHLARAVRLRDGRLIVNPGSVGTPGYRDVHPFPHVVEAGSPHARYAILELADGVWQVTFRHVAYDHEAMAALARHNGQPELANALATVLG